jgi:hypothetical protein
MTRIFAATLVVLICASPAWAGECEDDLAKIDAALASGDLPDDQRVQIEDMRRQAEQLCAAGNETEGLDITAEAKSLLQIE